MFIRIANLFLLLSVSTYSLQASSKIWVEFEDDLWGNFYIISKNGESKPAGIFRTADISELVKDDPKALKLAQLSWEYDTSGKIWYWSSLILYFSGVISASIVSSEGRPLTSKDKILLGSGIGLFTGGLISLFVSLSKFNTSRHYLFKAINAYNGVYEPEKKSFWLNNKRNKHASIVESNYINLFAFHYFF